MNCRHLGDFIASVNVIRVSEGCFSVELTVVCSECRQPLIFMGLPEGLLADKPTCDPLAIEARLPAQSPAPKARLIDPSRKYLTGKEN